MGCRRNRRKRRLDAVKEQMYRALEIMSNYSKGDDADDVDSFLMRVVNIPTRKEFWCHIYLRQEYSKESLSKRIQTASSIATLPRFYLHVMPLQAFHVGDTIAFTKLNRETDFQSEICFDMQSESPFLNVAAHVPLLTWKYPEEQEISGRYWKTFQGVIRIDEIADMHHSYEIARNKLSWIDIIKPIFMDILPLANIVVLFLTPPQYNFVGIDKSQYI
jgi:hypothetical protein